jgi:hypothetical protein
MGLVHGTYGLGGGLPAERRQPAVRRRPRAGRGDLRQGERDDLSQHAYHDTMAFMFETRTVIRPTSFALESAQLQHGTIAAGGTFSFSTDPTLNHERRMTTSCEHLVETHERVGASGSIVPSA